VHLLGGRIGRRKKRGGGSGQPPLIINNKSSKKAPVKKAVELSVEEKGKGGVHGGLLPHA